jgi:putative CRISPR-associated protein (TIGR02619 family)
MMNAIIFATVGTSALRNPGIGDVVGREKGAQLRSDVMTCLARPPELRDRCAAELDLEQRLTEAHVAYFRQKFSVCLDPRNYPMSAAELTSMPALLEAIKGRGETLQLLVLLASDTPEGKLAARVIQHVLTTPACFQLAPAAIEVVPVPGLNETFQNQFERLSSALGKQVCHVAPPRHVYINLTGGFKGTVPFLTQIAWNGGFALYYQHEAQSKSEIVEFAHEVPHNPETVGPAGTQVAPNARPRVVLVPSAEIWSRD